MNQIRHDLSRKLQTTLAEVLQRETKLAATVLETSDVAILFLESSVMMVRTSAATVAGWGGGDREATERLFHETYDAIVRMLMDSKAEALARTLAVTEARAA